MPIDSVPTFLLLCDKVLESQAKELASALRTGTGSINLKTLEDVLEARGNTFSKKLENNLKTTPELLLRYVLKILQNILIKRIGRIAQNFLKRIKTVIKF